MNEVNIYIHEPCNASISIARKIREWGSRKVQLWVCEEDLKKASPDIRGIVRNWRDGKSVERNITVDGSCFYCEWDFESWSVTHVVSDGLKALMARCRNQKLEFLVLGTSTKYKGQMIGFVDAPHDDSLPNGWCKFHWMTTYDAVLDYCKQHRVFDFDLGNAELFQPVEGHDFPIYKSLKTGYFIYLDKLHNDHYEVFNSKGEHLGEMTLNGDLDRTKADARKHFKL